MSRIALVVVDMQRRFFAGAEPAQPPLTSVVEYMDYAVGCFRAARAPVVWVYDVEDGAPGTAGYALVDGLKPQPGDGVVDKVLGDAFAEGGLGAELAKHGANALLVCGYAAEGCVWATVNGAQARGVPVFLLRDAVSSHRPGAARFVEGIAPLVSCEAIPRMLSAFATPERAPSAAARALDLSPVAPEDIDALADHLQRHSEENGRDGDVLFMPYGQDPPFERAGFAERHGKRLGQPLDASGWERSWVARDDAGVAIAHVDLHGDGKGPRRHRATLGMGIERRWRRRGLGWRLLQHALAWAREAPSLDWVDLGVLAHNQPARELYRRAGFIEVGTTADLLRVDGRVIDDVAMAAWVGPPPG